MMDIWSMGMFMFDSLVDVAMRVLAILKNFLIVMIVVMMFVIMAMAVLMFQNGMDMPVGMIFIKQQKDSGGQDCLKHWIKGTVHHLGPFVFELDFDISPIPYIANCLKYLSASSAV